MLVLLLSFTAYNTLKKAMKMYKIESIHILKQQQKESELAAMAANKEVHHESESEYNLLEKEDGDEDKEEGLTDMDMDPELRMILEQEKVAPARNVKLLILLFIAVLIVNVLKGGGAFESP